MAFENGEMIEFLGSSPVRCIHEAKKRIASKNLKVLKIQSVVEYLSPVNEIIEAVHQLTA